MQLLLIVAGVIAVLWPVYWMLTRRKLPVRRRWSWRRFALRTLDHAVVDRGAFGCLISAPVALFLPGALVFGLNPTGPGLIGAGVVGFVLAVAVAWRGWKWMGRSWRPTRDWLRERKANRLRR